jgi:hypothetical protein
MDDGTPEHYLNKVQQAYPEVQIICSDNHYKKSNLVQDLHAAPTKLQQRIPVELWKKCVRKSSTIFLLLEEDSWFTDGMDLNEALYQSTLNHLDIVKLGWNSNPQSIYGAKISLSNSIEEIIPSLPLTNPLLLSVLLKNTFKIRSILVKTKLLPINFFVPYYSLYTVASALFNKTYWLQLWDSSQQQVNEMNQLMKAFEWSRKSQRHYGKYHKEIIKTSFLTSSNPSGNVNGFNINLVNHYLNKAWLNDRLDTMMNYPSDFSTAYLKNILSREGAPANILLKWQAWINWFKIMNQNTGNKIE